MLKPFLLSLFISSSIFFNCAAQTAKQFKAQGDSLFYQQKYTEAIDQYDKAIALEKDALSQAVIHDMKGQSFYKLKKYTEGLKEENQSLSANVKYGSAYWNRGAINDALKSYQAAVDDYSSAITYYKDSSSLSKLYNYRGYVKYKLKLYNEAIKDDSIAIKLNPKYESAYWHRAMANHSLGNYTVSNKDYEVALLYETNKNDLATIYNNMANNSRSASDFKKAIEYQTSAITINPDNGDYYWNRGIAYQSLDAYQFAIDDFDKAITFFKSDSNALAVLYNNRAFANVFFGKPDIGIRDNAQALKYNSKFKFAYTIKGLAYGAVGKHIIAADAYKAGLKLYHESPQQYNPLYRDWVDEKFYNTRPDSLIKYCDTAIFLNPKNPQVYYTRGKVYLKKLKDLNLAVADFNKTIELDTTRKSVSYIFSLYYLGKDVVAMDLANAKILKSKTDKDLSVAYYNIACLYSLMNKKDEAINYLQFAFDKGYNKKYAIADDDFDNIRNSEEFKKLVAN